MTTTGATGSSTNNNVVTVGEWAHDLKLEPFLLPNVKRKKEENQSSSSNNNNNNVDPKHMANFFTTKPVYQSPKVSFRPRVNKRGGGRGVFALENIEAGSLIMSEIPISEIPSHPPDRDPAERFVLHLTNEKNALSRLERVAIMENIKYLHPQSLHDITQEHLTFIKNRSAKLLSEMQTNTIAIDLNLNEADTLYRVICALHFNGFTTGVYLHLAMVNHSCCGNCVKWGVREGVVHSEVRATRRILAGEEISFSYLVPSMRSREARQRALTGQFQFTCQCQLCTGALVDAGLLSLLQQDVGEEEVLESALEALEESLHVYNERTLRDLINLRVNSKLNKRNLSLAHLNMRIAEACLVLLDENAHPDRDVIFHLFLAAVELRKTQLLYYKVGDFNDSTLELETRSDSEATLQHISSCVMYFLNGSGPDFDYFYNSFKKALGNKYFLNRNDMQKCIQACDRASKYIADLYE